jgi:hypothetical protein
MDKIKSIEAHILDEVCNGLTCEDPTRGRMHKTNEGASLRLYQRPVLSGVILYVEHPGVADPIVMVGVSFGATTFAVEVSRCDVAIIDRPKQRSYPIARFSHGVASTVKAVREQVKLVLGARLVDGIESAPPVDEVDPSADVEQ